MRNRIVISINSAWNFVNFRANLLRALVAQGYDVIAVAPADSYVPRIEELGVRFVSIAMDPHGTSPVNDLRLLLAFYSILRRERPTAFLGYTIKPNVYGSLAARALGIPVINNIAGLGETFRRGNWLNRVARFLYRVSLRRSRVIFFQNREQRELFVNDGLASEEVARVLPGSGIDLARFSPVPPNTRKDGAACTFLLLARLLWTKGIGDFVEAARIVRGQHPNARFLIAGILDEQQPSGIPRTVVQQWREEGVVEIVDAVDDVRPLIEAADCVVLPTSYPEGTPRSLLEAAAMGRPIITTDVPGCKDLVDHRQNGYLCKPNDVASIVRGLEWMIERSPAEREQIGRASREKAERDYDEQIVIAAYLAALDEIAVRP